jgi:hypothetical protein
MLIMMMMMMMIITTGTNLRHQSPPQTGSRYGNPGRSGEKLGSPIFAGLQLWNGQALNYGMFDSCMQYRIYLRSQP